MRKVIVSAALALILSAGAVQAAEGGPQPPTHPWPWTGPFGTFDRAQLRRGLKVYREVCSSCHSLNLIAFRNLTALGYTADDVKAIAAQYEVLAGPNDEGDTTDSNGNPLTRPGTPSDYFPAPFRNEQAARAANGGALPPDLSLITKARKNGYNYIYALITQGYEGMASESTLRTVFEQVNHAHMATYESALADYETKVAEGEKLEKPEPPKPVGTIKDLQLPEGKQFNAYFPGYAISMPPPLFDGAVDYEDGTPTTKEQLARDVISFLAWAGHPEMETRKRTGVAVLLFLVVLTGMMLALKRQIWRDVH